MKKVIETDKAPAALGPYSQAILTNGVLYASGQLGIHLETGEMASGRLVGNLQTIQRLIALLNIYTTILISTLT